MKKQKSKRDSFFVGFLVVMIILGTGSWAVYWFGYKDMTAARQKSDVVQAERLPFDLTNILTVDQVRQSATASTVARMRSLELAKIHGVLVYTVGLSDGSVITLDARTGDSQKTSSTPSHIASADTVLPPDVSVAVSFDQAREIAQQHFPEGSIIGIILTTSSGNVIIRVLLGGNGNIDIDADSGDVLQLHHPTL